MIFIFLLVFVRVLKLVQITIYQNDLNLSETINFILRLKSHCKLGQKNDFLDFDRVKDWKLG